MTIAEILKLPKHHFTRIRYSHFARNVATVATGTAGAQTISMAFAPLLTRIYGPEAFGLLGAFMALVNIVAPVAALTYPIAIVLPKDDIDALEIARLSVYISFAIATLFALVLWAGHDWLTRVLSAQSIATFILFIPLVMLFSAWVQIAQQWLIRKKEFRLYARIAVVQSILLNSAKTGVGWFHPVTAVLLIVATFGPLLNATMLFIGAKLRYRNAFNITHDIGQTPIKQLAFRHRDFPLYRAPKVVIDAISAALPVFGLTTLIGSSEAGFFTLAISVLSMPAALIAKSVENVLYPQLSKTANEFKKLSPLVFKSTLWLAFIAIWPFAFIAMFGPFLFETVFGGDWRDAGVYSQWLSLWLFASFVIRAFYCAVPVLSIQRVNMIIDIFTLCLSALSIIVGLYLFKDPVWGVALYAIAGTIGRVLLGAFVTASLYRFDSNLRAYS